MKGKREQTCSWNWGSCFEKVNEFCVGSMETFQLKSTTDIPLKNYWQILGTNTFPLTLVIIKIYISASFRTCYDFFLLCNGKNDRNFLKQIWMICCQSVGQSVYILYSCKGFLNGFSTWLLGNFVAFFFFFFHSSEIPGLYMEII